MFWSFGKECKGFDVLFFCISNLNSKTRGRLKDTKNLLWATKKGSKGSRKSFSSSVRSCCKNPIHHSASPYYCPWVTLRHGAIWVFLWLSKHSADQSINAIASKLNLIALFFPEESIGKGFRILSLLKKKFYLISKGVKILRSLFTEQRGYSYRTVCLTSSDKFFS